LTLTLRHVVIYSMNITSNTQYTITKLVKLAGISIRTLHHYDQIGLLKATFRTAANYRIYSSHDLVRLQQILFFRELEMPLKDIKSILDNPDFNQQQALEDHRKLLNIRVARLKKLINTIADTIKSLNEDPMTLTDKELYAGFSKEKITRYKKEVKEKYDPDLVTESNRRIGKMSKQQWHNIQAEGDAVTQAIADRADRPHTDPEVQDLIGRHHQWIEKFYPADNKVYTSLARLYTSNNEFRAYYEKYRPGLADYFAAAMTHFADTRLKPK